MNQERRDMLQTLVNRMDAQASLFYRGAQAVGHHQWIEFTGFLNEYVKMCQRMLDAGKDFQNCEIEPKSFEVNYIREKLGCIFGEKVIA